jgi:hypothetical protein
VIFGKCENLLTHPLLRHSGVSSSAEVNSMSSFTKCSVFYWWLHKLLYLFLSIQQLIFLLHWKLRPFMIMYQAVTCKLYTVESVHISYIFAHNSCCYMFWHVWLKCNEDILTGQYNYTNIMPEVFHLLRCCTVTVGHMLLSFGAIVSVSSSRG